MKNIVVFCNNDGECFAKRNDKCTILASGYDRNQCPFQEEKADEYKGKRYPAPRPGFHKYN